MIQILSNGDIRDAAPRCKQYSQPKLDGDVFASVRCGPVWEVRCWSHKGGKLTGNQLVMTCLTEQEADAQAMRLTGIGEGEQAA